MLVWEPWSASSPPLVSCPAPWSQQRFPCWTCGRFANLMCVILLNWLEDSPKKLCLTLHLGDYTQVFRHMSAPVRTSLRKLFAEHGKAAKTTACIDMENLQLRGILQSEPTVEWRADTFNHRIVPEICLHDTVHSVCIYSLSIWIFSYAHVSQYVIASFSGKNRWSWITCSSGDRRRHSPATLEKPQGQSKHLWGQV